MPNGRGGRGGRGGGAKRAPLPERFKYEREAARLSQADLALRLGRSQTWVSRVESGDQRVPADFVPIYADALGITIGRLYELEHQRTYAKAS